MLYGCCFICGEDDVPLYKVCNCDTWIHERCMIKLINEVPTHKNFCPVCTLEYKYREIRTKYSWKCSDCNLVYMRFIVFLYCGAGSIILSGLLITDLDRQLIPISIILYSFSFVGLLSFYIFFKYVTGFWCPFGCRQSAKEIEVNPISAKL